MADELAALYGRLYLVYRLARAATGATVSTIGSEAISVAGSDSTRPTAKIGRVCGLTQGSAVMTKRRLVCCSVIRAPFRPTRSEERRVGKEGRSRWSPYH